MKISYLFLFILTFILFGNKIFAQENTENLKGFVKIVYAEISYQGSITEYEAGNTSLYPNQKISVNKRSYKGIFRIKLLGANFVIKKPLIIRCYLSNGGILIRKLYHDSKYLYANKIYEFTFNFNTDEILFGETKVELLKPNSKSLLNNSNDTSILDETNIYIR
jgi:hypothetical protein